MSLPGEEEVDPALREDMLGWIAATLSAGLFGFVVGGVRHYRPLHGLLTTLAEDHNEGVQAQNARREHLAQRDREAQRAYDVATGREQLRGRWDLYGWWGWWWRGYYTGCKVGVVFSAEHVYECPPPLFFLW
jgi:hypothetical protein